MRYDNHRATNLLDSIYRLDQLFFTLIIKVGIGLIQYHQLGVIVDRPRQSYSLPLSARENPAGSANHSVVALGQA